MAEQGEIAEADRRGDARPPRETPHLFGQEHAEQAFLEASATGRLHHAMLITGPEGVGKATLAWRIARRQIAGNKGETLEMDVADPVFRRVSQLSSPALFLCRRPWDEKTRRLKTAITVDEVRSLNRFLQMSATDGGWRVAIVDSADELNVQAANALLKMLEEPPDNALFLLVSHAPSRLLPTIRSRCRTLRCTPLNASDMHSALAAAGVEDNMEDGGYLAEISGGSPGRAMELIESDGVSAYEALLEMLRLAPPVDRARAIALGESCVGRDAAQRYQMVTRLIILALSRLALAAAGSSLQPVSRSESELIERLGVSEAQARLWAELAAELTARTEQARNVNLDPAQVILDTLLRIDATASEARGLAA